MLTLSALELVEHHGEGDPVRVIQGLAQAIDFIAGGLIFVRGGDVRNMTTATTLWMAAAVGITAGAGQYILVLAGTGLAVLLLIAATRVERVLPKKVGSPDHQKSGANAEPVWCCRSLASTRRA